MTAHSTAPQAPGSTAMMTRTPKGVVFAFPAVGHYAARFLLWQGQYNAHHVYALRFRCIQEGDNLVLSFDSLTNANAQALLDHLNTPAA